MTTVARATRFVRRTLDALLLVLIALALAAIVLARIMPWITGGTTLVVGGGSMEPSIPLGSAIHVIPVPAEQLGVGDVVSLQVGPANAVFTHRIVRIVERPDGRWLETKGDANTDVDPSIVPASAVVGRVALQVPAAGYLITLLTLPQGVLFLLGIAGSLLAAVWLLETLELDQHTASMRRATTATGPRAEGRSASGRGGRTTRAAPEEALAGDSVAVAAAARAITAAVALDPARAMGEPIAARPILAAPIPIDRDRPSPPAAPSAPSDSTGGSRGTGERLAMIRERHARRARWEAGARAGGASRVWAADIATVRVQPTLRAARTRFAPG